MRIALVGYLVPIDHPDHSRQRNVARDVVELLTTRHTVSALMNDTVFSQEARAYRSVHSAVSLKELLHQCQLLVVCGEDNTCTEPIAEMVKRGRKILFMPGMAGAPQKIVNVPQKLRLLHGASLQRILRCLTERHDAPQTWYQPPSNYYEILVEED